MNELQKVIEQLRERALNLIFESSRESGHRAKVTYGRAQGLREAADLIEQALPADTELQVEGERVEKVAEWLYQRFSFGAVGASLEASAQATRFRNLARELLALIGQTKR